MSKDENFLVFQMKKSFWVKTVGFDHTSLTSLIQGFILYSWKVVQLQIIKQNCLLTLKASYLAEQKHAHMWICKINTCEKLKYKQHIHSNFRRINIHFSLSEKVPEFSPLQRATLPLALLQVNSTKYGQWGKLNKTLTCPARQVMFWAKLNLTFV